MIRNTLTEAVQAAFHAEARPLGAAAVLAPSAEGIPSARTWPLSPPVVAIP